jgi:hypothetical protein
MSTTATDDAISLYTVTIVGSGMSATATVDKSSTGTDTTEITEEGLPDHQPAEFRYVIDNSGMVTREQIVERTETYVIQLGDASMDVPFGAGYTASVNETDDILRYTSLEDAVRKATLDKATGTSTTTPRMYDDMMLQWATYEGATVDSNNPYNATVTFRFMDDDIIFNYRLSGDDTDDVRLVQDGNDVFLETRAGPNLARPTDADNASTYEITEYITTSFDFADDTLESVMNDYVLTII